MTDDPRLPELTAICPHCEGAGKVFADHAAVGASQRRRREAKGLEAKELAARMGISAQYLSDLERGKRPWSLSLVRRYWAALEVAALTE